jgi:NADPH:quinone reductase-like Zn-dependent oxidoreductase
VRRAEQVELLRKMGAEHVLNTSDPGFDASLGDLCHRFGASIGLDAVAGEMSARVLRAQPCGSRLLVYGALSLEASQIDPASLIFEGKRVEGFWLPAHGTDVPIDSPRPMALGCQLACFQSCSLRRRPNGSQPRLNSSDLSLLRLSCSLSVVSRNRLHNANS